MDILSIRKRIFFQIIQDKFENLQGELENSSYGLFLAAVGLKRINKNYQHKSTYTMLNSGMTHIKGAQLYSSLPNSRNTSHNKQDTAWEVYCATIFNKNEEMNVIQLADWRQKTSMPIVRVKHYTIQKKQQYPKKCEIQIERISKCFQKLKQIDIYDSLYLLREALMGYQTLSYKFGPYNIAETICGVNESGQCRVWLSKDVSEVPQCSGSSLKAYEMTLHLIKKLILMTKNSQREKLRQLHLQVQKNQSITYGKLFSLIKDFAKKYKITIPSYMKRQRVHHRSSIQREGISERETYNQQQIKKWSAQKNLSLRCTSPLLRQLKSCHSTGKQISTKPKINWKSTSLNQSLNGRASPSPSTPATPATPWNTRGHSISNCEVSSIRLDKTEEKQSPLKKLSSRRRNISIQEFKIEEQVKVENKTYSRKKLESPKTNHSSNSLWTTQMTDSSKDQINLEKSGNMKQPSIDQNIRGSQKNSQRDQSPANMKLSKTYNFGGLITVPQIQEKQKKEDDKKSGQKQKQLRWDFKDNKLEGKSKLIQSYTSQKFNDEKDDNQSNDGYRSEFLDTVGNIDTFWGSKMINFFEQSRCLKESLHCGEDIKAPQMEFKLQKLGKLGRDIKTSVVPDL